MTNGEMILQLFPRSEVDFKGVITKFLIDGYSYEFSKSWWDKEYEEAEAEDGNEQMDLY